MTASPQIPSTKAARHALIAQILDRQPVRSQTELADALAEHGLSVTQATLSRDLVELQAERTRDADGVLVYALPPVSGVTSPQRGAVAKPPENEKLASRLARLCVELLVTAEGSANIVILRTPPGAAQFLASAIDQSVMPSLLGTIAGDDTVLVVTREPDGGRAAADRFLALATPGSPQEES